MNGLSEKEERDKQNEEAYRQAFSRKAHAPRGGGPAEGNGRVISVNLPGQLDEVRTREVPIRQAKPGQRFELHLTTVGKVYRGTFLRPDIGTSLVQMDGARSATHWSTSTPVVLLDEFGGGNGATQEAVKSKGATSAKEKTMGPETAVALPGVGAKVAPTAAQRAKANAAKRAAAKPAKPAKAAKPTKEKTPKQLSECLCGCGEMVAGRFRMGHDARYHGWLGKLASGMSIADVNAKSSRAISDDVKRALKATGKATLQAQAKALLAAH